MRPAPDSRHHMPCPSSEQHRPQPSRAPLRISPTARITSLLIVATPNETQVLEHHPTYIKQLSCALCATGKTGQSLLTLAVRFPRHGTLD